tara:strand:- start:43 stop:678 length:636 start_codon:yes stop_codon:yes gene_type:complete
MDKSIQIDTFIRLTRVSRETITSLIKYEKLLIDANKSLNLIGKSTINSIWDRHFLDSAQVIDFIGKNFKTLIDLGSGAGFPGLVIALLARDRKISLKVNLLEKSPRKAEFLNKLASNLNLNVKVTCEDISKNQYIFMEDVLVARAFKPLEVIFKLIHNRSKKWKKFFVFLGKTGKQELLQASKRWDIQYKQWVSVTNNDSIILEIDNLKKK